MWSKKRVYAILWGIRGEEHAEGTTAAAVQRVLEIAHDQQAWPSRLPKEVRRQNVPGDSTCLYWALSGVEGRNTRSVVEEIHRELTEGDRVRPPKGGCERRVIQEARVGMWEEYLRKVGKGEIWGGVCEVSRWALFCAACGCACTGSVAPWLSFPVLVCCAACVCYGCACVGSVAPGLSFPLLVCCVACVCCGSGCAGSVAPWLSFPVLGNVRPPGQARPQKGGGDTLDHAEEEDSCKSQA